MITYRIIIKNETGAEIENILINADNETQAILYYLKDNDDIINTGDTIKIEEY